MSLKYADIVYAEQQPELVWCECRAVMHTVVEVRYQLLLFAASEEYAPSLIYRKGEQIAASSWKRTPKECRDHLRAAYAFELDKSRIVWEDAVSIAIPILDNRF